MIKNRTGEDKETTQQAVGKYLSQSVFVQNVLTLMTGTAVAQAISILVAPVLTRLYSPEEYGEYNVYIQLVSIGTILATLRYEHAILFSKRNTDSNNILAGIVGINFIVSSTFFIFSLLFVQPLNELLGIKGGSFLLVFLGSSVFLGGLIQVLQFFLNRYKRYREYSKGRLIQSSSTGLISIALHPLGTLGLVLGQVLGSASSLLYLIAINFKKKKNIIKSIRPSAIKDNLIKNRNYPLFTTWHAFLNTASSATPIFILGSFFDATIIGFYALGLRMVQMPISLLIQSLSNVLSEKVYQDFQKNKLKTREIKRMIFKAILKTGPLFLVAILIAPYAFEIIFGAEWKKAGVYLHLVGPWIFMTLFAGPLAFVPQMVEQQSKALIIEAFFFIIKIAGLLVGCFYQNEFLAIGMFSLVGLIYVIYCLLWYLRLLKKAEHSL